MLRTFPCSPKAHSAFGACLRPAFVSLDSLREIGLRFVRERCLYCSSPIRQETPPCSIFPFRFLPVLPPSASCAARLQPCACYWRRSSAAPDIGPEVSCRRTRRCSSRTNLPSVMPSAPAPLPDPATRHGASAMSC